MDCTATIKAPAKLNLSLRITGLRQDGYHELDTLFFRLEEPFDLLHFGPGAPGTGLALSCDLPGLAPEKNLAHKAYTAFAAATGFKPDLTLDLEKNIPTGAGLGGGSSDAAAVLIYMNARAGDDALSPDQLTILAASLGADVPFFLLSGPARATGIGEKLVPISLDMDSLTLVVACPDAHVDTAWAYGEFDRVHGLARGALTTVRTDNTRPAPASPPVFQNDFESVVFRAFPEIRLVKEELIRSGAAAAAMSGSGASVFAWFRSREMALQAADALEARRVKMYIRR